MIRLTLYTKPDCCLCEEALEVIERVRQEIPLDLEEVDVSSDRDLEHGFGRQERDQYLEFVLPRDGSDPVHTLNVLHAPVTRLLPE